MARELRIGMPVDASDPDVTGYVFDMDERYRRAVVMVPVTFGLAELRPANDMPPCPYIPRECIADLHAAVRKRMEQLDTGFVAGSDDAQDDWPEHLAHTELATFAEALRLLLEATDAD